MEVKCFVICTDLLLPLKLNFSYFKIQIFMLLKLEYESAIESGIRIRRFFGRIAIPDFNSFLIDCDINLKFFKFEQKVFSCSNTKEQLVTLL